MVRVMLIKHMYYASEVGHPLMRAVLLVRKHKCLNLTITM